MRRLLLLALICLPSFGAVAHVKAQGTTASTTGNSKTFSYTAAAAGDGVIFLMGCAGVSEATTTLTATGWTITKVAGPFGASATTGFTTSFMAYAPNTSATTFTVTWNNGCGSFFSFLIDEFSGVDATNFVDAISSSSTGTSGGCTATVTPVTSNDMIWSGCLDSITAAGSGYTKGADDSAQDWTEFKLLSGGAGVAQTAVFVPSSGTSFNAQAIAIKPAGGGPPASSTCTLTLLGAGPC